MAVTLTVVVAVLGNIASMSLYAAPTVTFKRVIRKKSTEEFSCIPYIIALMNSLLYTWYGLPIVSNKWENFPLVTVNGVGVLFELSYVLIYFWFSSPKAKVKVAMIAAAVLTVVGVIGIVSTFAIPDHRHRKLLVGSISLGVSIALYASPLVAMKKVIETKSVEFMPLPLSLSSLFASLMWMTYGLLIRDIFVAGPNVVGTPLGILQLVLYCKYWKRRPTEEPNKQYEHAEKLDMEIGHDKNLDVSSN